MADDEREDSATQADDNEDTDERPKPQVKKPETTSAPAPGDDIIIK